MKKSKYQMKITFTPEEMDAIETAYYDSEGYLPCDISHIPNQKEYQILQKLWIKMSDKIESNTIKR